MLSSAQTDNIWSINFFGSVLSVLGAFFVEVVILAIALYDKKLVDRVSLRLNAFISLVDLIRAVAMIATSTLYIQNTKWCSILPFILIWMMNLWYFLIACIAYNLHLLFVVGKPPRESREKWYYILSTGISFTLAFSLLLARKIGYDSE